MTPRDRLRLLAILGPLIPQLPPHLRAEASRLLGPGPREDVPDCARTAESWPAHEHRRADPTRF